MQRSNSELKAYLKRKFPKQKVNPKYSVEVIDDVDIVVYEKTQMIIPKSLRSNIVNWYITNWCIQVKQDSKRHLICLCTGLK